MFTIQTGSKFLKVEYYIKPDEVFNIKVSDTPKIYKTRASAQTDLTRAVDWLAKKIDSAEKSIRDAEAKVVKNRKVVESLQANLAGLLDLPFRDVEQQVATVRKSIARAESNIDYHNLSIRSFRQDLARYNRIRTAGASVVGLQQTVEAL